VIGDGEVENGSVNVRRYGSQATESLSIQELIDSLVKEVKEKR
jgi:threonyl-tRNA synthetase